MTITPSTPSGGNAPLGTGSSATTGANKRPASQSPDATPPNAKALASSKTPPRPGAPATHHSPASGNSKSSSPKSGASTGRPSPQGASPAGNSSPANTTNLVPPAVNPPVFGGPLQPAVTAPGGLIPNLVITAMEEKQESVKTTSNQRYPIIEEIIHKALKIMETKAGIETLGLVATTVINRRIEKAQGQAQGQAQVPVHTWGNRPFSDMAKEMKTFVQKLRANFPPIHLKNMSEDAWTKRWLWPSNRDIAQVPIPDLAQFHPSECLILELNTKIISNLMKAMEKRTNGIQGMDQMIQVFHFQLMIIVMHEIIHMLVCALTGAGRPTTPDNMTVSGNDKPESGWWWEIQAFGGIVTMLWDKNETVLKERQAGIPMLADGHHVKSLVKDIDRAFIAEFVKDSPKPGFSYFPIPTVTSTTTETLAEAMERCGNRVGAVMIRTRAVLNPSKNNSPEPKKAPKPDTPPTRTSSRTKTASSSAARENSPSPAPRTRPATALPIVGGRPAS